MKNRSILLLAGLLIAVVFSCLMVRNASLERQVARQEMLIVAQQRENAQQRVQISMLGKKVIISAEELEWMGKRLSGIPVADVLLKDLMKQDAQTAICRGGAEERPHRAD